MKSVNKYDHIHAPKFYVRYAQRKPVNFPLNFQVYPGSIYGRYQDKNGNQVFWICENFRKTSQGYQILFSNGKDGWFSTTTDSNSTIYKYITIAIRKLGFIPTVNKTHERVDYAQLMRTYSCHKKGTGSRINTRQINNPLQWNEVTEDAHWFGKGNASVIGNNCRYD